MFSISSWNQSLIVLSLLAGTAGSAAAAGGTIRFSGAITEPACTVNRATATTATGVPSRAKEVIGQMQLAVRCNTSQSVQISFDEINDANGQRSFNAGGGAEMLLSHANKSIAPGDSIRYTFAGKKDAAIGLSTLLRKGSNTDVSAPQSHILVSFNYQ